MSDYEYKTEGRRMIHLIVLLEYTIYATFLSLEAVYHGWEGWAVVVCLSGLLLCWVMHTRQLLTPPQRLLVYECLQMVMFFYYGVHGAGVLDLTPVILLVIIIFHMTGNAGYVYIAAGTYFVTVLYVMAMGRGTSIGGGNLIRILLHLAVVLLSVVVSKIAIAMREGDAFRAEERIRQLAEDNRRTEDFLTNVSHELRTPINAVTGISAVLLKSDVNAKTKTGLVSIQEAGHRLFEQIGDILDHTEINTGKLVISEESYMISSVITDILAELTLLGVKTDVDVIFDVDANVPSVLLGDGRKIKKIIRHLVENAIKFTRVGGTRVRIESIRKPYGINLCIEVSDTGIGIGEMDLERITEQFFQTDSSRSRSAGGLGLGLSIVAGLVSAMNGFMHISSTKDEGTTVCISIPQHVADAAPCMTLERAGDVDVCCYIRPGLYANARVWDFYNEMLTSMANGMQASVHRVTNIAELRGLGEQEDLTHVLTGWNEYEADADYFDELSKRLTVVVIADEGVAPTEDSGIRILRKPLSPFPIINLLNARHEGELERNENGRMLCPGARVLVVDDEVMNIVVARGIFKEYQISVESAMSGVEALEICRDRAFDIIFMDHMMPGMDGVEAEHRIRQLPLEKRPVVVALTANAVSGAREMFLSEGFDDFLSKPIETTELERVFRKLLPPGKVIYDDVAIPSVPEEDDGEPEVIEAEEKMEEMGSIGEGIDKLLAYLSSYEAVSAEGILNRLDDVYGGDAAVHEALAAIANDIRSFEMHEAMEKARALRKKMGDGR